MEEFKIISELLDKDNVNAQGSLHFNDDCPIFQYDINQMLQFVSKYHSDKDYRNLNILFLIIYHVCKYFKISYETLHSGRKITNTAQARHVYMYITRKLLPNCSYAKIAFFIHKDHATFINSFAKVDAAKEKMEEIYLDYLNVNYNVTEQMKGIQL